MCHKRIILTVAIATMCAAQAQPVGYDGLPADKKADYLWSQITADEAGGAFMAPLKTLLYAGNPAYLRKMAAGAASRDWREPTHKKITHGKGAQARAHITWSANPYSGMFQQADHCIVRMANAAMPGALTSPAYGPNLAIKCLNDASVAVNLQALWQLDGYAELPAGVAKAKSCSYFEAPLSSHTPLRDSISAALKDTFVKDFQVVDPHSMLVGTSQFANLKQHGRGGKERVAKPHFPFGLVFAPKAGLNDVPCVFKEFISQLTHPSFDNGTALFDIYAVAEPWLEQPKGTPNVTKIGELTLDSPFVSSTYGDTRLFFAHTFFAAELKELGKLDEARMERWVRYTNSTDFMKTEGAMLYQPFLKTEDVAALTVGRRPLP